MAQQQQSVQQWDFRKKNKKEREVKKNEQH